MRTSALAAALLVLLAGCGSPPPPAPPPAPPIPPPPAVTAACRGPSPSAEAAPATPPPPADDKLAGVTIKVQKVAGTVYMLEGAGGNIAVSVGEDGIVLVDDQFAPLASKIKDALRGITTRPIRVVLNTHWHGDHTGGNAIFGAGAPIIAHENVRKRLAAGGPKVQLGSETHGPTPPAAREALPIVTFQDNVSVHLNGEEIKAIHMASGHTDGDSIVYFTRSNVVHMGDDFVTYGFPYVDLTSGGSVKGLIAAIDKVVHDLPPDVKVIPGHGKLSTIEDMKALSVKLKACVRLVEAEVKKKKTLDEIKAAKVLAKYDDMGQGFVKTDTFVEIVFKELKKQQNVFVPH